MDFLILVLLHVAAIPWLARGARMKAAMAIQYALGSPIESDKCPDWAICELGSCNIANSNHAAGKACECLPGFSGRIKWHKGVPLGTCTAAACRIVGVVGEGPNCKCAPGLSGTISWDRDTPKGECHVDAAKLFKSGTLTLTTGAGEKEIKCCVSSQGKPTQLQDLRASDVPSHGKAKRITGNRHGCGYMFGDSYHSAGRDACPVEISKLMHIADLSYVDALTLLDIDTAAAQQSMPPHNEMHNSIDRPDIGIYVRLVQDLDYESKAKMIGSQIETALGTALSWFSYGLVPFIGNATFMKGLKSELLPVLEAQLRKSGVQYTLRIIEDDKKAFAFLLTIIGIDANAFVKENIGAVRDGLLASLIESDNNLVTTLEKQKVPDASINALPVSDNGVKLLIRVSKAKLLERQIGTKAFARIVDFLPIERVTSASIGEEIALQLEAQMMSQLADNGILAKVEASVTGSNGEKDKGEEFIEVGVRIEIVRLRKNRFEKVQLVSVRDTVVRQLSGGLQHELLAQGFPARVQTIRCGWKGPFPIKDRIENCNELLHA